MWELIGHLLTYHQKALLRLLGEAVAAHGQLIRLGGQHEAAAYLLGLLGHLDGIAVLGAAQGAQRGVQILASMMRGEAKGRRGAYAIAVPLALLPLALVLACNTESKIGH